MLTIHAEPQGLRRPVLILAWGGWNDAAEAATTAARREVRRDRPRGVLPLRALPAHRAVPRGLGDRARAGLARDGVLDRAVARSRARRHRRRGDRAPPQAEGGPG